MQELEPPEAPIDASSMDSVKPKEGFFKKLFSWRKKNETPEAAANVNLNFANLEMPPVEDNIDLSGLPELPALDMQEGNAVFSKEYNKRDAKSKKAEKSMKKNQGIKQDFKSSYESIQPTEYQRNDDKNSEVNALMEQAYQQVAEQKLLLKPDKLLTASEPVTANVMETPDIPDMHTELNQLLKGEPINTADSTRNIIPEMPVINSLELKAFDRIERDHERLRQQLTKKVDNSNKAFNKTEFVQLLKQYYDKIEKRIEERQIMVSDKRNKLERFHKLLTKKEHELKNLHKYFKKLNNILKQKETKLNEIISSSVDKQLAKRSVKEKILLRKELKKTMLLNSQLQKKLNILEKDRVMFEKKQKEILNTEQSKLNASQEVYEKKLQELDSERKAFESRRSAALDLLNRGEAISKELTELEKVKEFVTKTKTKLRKELTEDKELKQAIYRAENRLKSEKNNLDNMIFSKYIESKLKSIVPESIARNTVGTADNNMGNSRIYDMINDCKEMIAEHKIPEAKRLYNNIKRIYENSKFDRIERSMLYNSIRALYNDIELAEVEEKL